MPHLVDEFVSWARELSVDDVPDTVKEAMGHRLADAVGLIARAWDTRPGRIVREVSYLRGGSGARLLFDPTPVSADVSAFAHGSLIHSLDYDDTFPDSVIHPISVLFASGWASLDQTTTGAELLRALVVADEFLARVGAAAGRALHARGFHSTSVFGPLAAALVAGLLHDRSPAQIRAAIGLSGSMSGGVLEFLHDGSWSKRLHPGWAAQSGVVADLLGSRGFTGPGSILEGAYGVFRAFADVEVDPEVVVDGLGTAWISQTAQIKLYPCAHVLHPFIEAARTLSVRSRSWQQIERIECRVAPWYVPIVCEPHERKLAPDNEYEARTSLPLVVAAAFVDGDVDDRTFEPAQVARSEIAALARRVAYVPDADLERGFGARLQVEFGDGTKLELQTPKDPDGHERLRRKFYGGMSRLSTTTPPDETSVTALWEVLVGFPAVPVREWAQRLEAYVTSQPGT